MGEIIHLSKFRSHAAQLCTELSQASEMDNQRITAIRDHVEHLLDTMTREEDLPLTIAMSAGRFAAMRMFQLQGRAETLAFIDQCITTAELCDDIVRNLDEDA
ncbi:MAG: hypothetical protein CMC82_02950 [Flavobacteriaceae bacterium]|nr:hypothetical protein [Flavobacteriaceae bacterium]|tara:strand:+ start:2071 stop:2379 length:309 start_codon:yes stop_codon:yes gene_type:complete